MADTLLVMLTSWQQHPIQEVQGQLFGMSQSHANKWIHRLHPVWHQALADQDVLPARTAAECAAMCKARTADGRSPPPRFGLMGLNVRSTARLIPKSHKKITAASRSVPRATTAS
jgi:hypothetical protein